MGKYPIQKDYSMPRFNGLYPPPPYEYPKMRAMVVLFQCAEGVKETFLPPELKPVEYGFDCIFFSEYPDSSIGPYMENLILLNCTHKETNGLFVANIYVDSDEALTAGREIWGYPKKMCDIKLSPITKKTVKGSLTRRNITFLEVEVKLFDEPPGMDPKAMIENMPLFNLKMIPDVANNKIPALRQITQTDMKWNNFTKKLGAMTLSIKTQYSEYDICHEFINDSNKNLGGF